MDEKHSCTGALFAIKSETISLQDSVRWSRGKKICGARSKTCETCQMWKRRRFREDLGFIEASEVSDVVGIDVLGPLSQQAGAPSKYILVAVDYFSRWAETRTVRSPTRKRVEEFLNDWMRKHGKIQMILTDSGSQFTSPTFVAWIEHRGIDLRLSAPYHHSSNGLVERKIQTLLGRIRRLKKATHSPWSQLVQRSRDAINSSVHRVTRCSPEELRFGLDCKGDLLDPAKWTERKKLVRANTRVERLNGIKNVKLSAEKKLKLRAGMQVLVYQRPRKTLSKLEAP